MLTDERLGRTDRINEFVDAVGMIGEEIDDGEADGGGQRAEQIARCVVPLPCTYAP